MLFYPQLETGANGQFPALRRTVRRTLASPLADGRVVKLADPGAAAVEWSLAYEGLSAAEVADIEALFIASRGRLKTFTFLDPLDNLLRHSEDLSAAAWTKEAGIATTVGFADPSGGNAASRVTNSSGAPRRVSQQIMAPGSFQYCFSLYARADAATELTLFEDTVAEESVRTAPIGPAWRRIELAAKLASIFEPVTFGAAVPAGVSVELFGLQVDAQVAASAYKRTTSRAGVYTNARFATDLLGVTTEGPNCHSCSLRIRAVN